jgi:hypothetical protein
MFFDLSKVFNLKQIDSRIKHTNQRLIKCKMSQLS